MKPTSDRPYVLIVDDEPGITELLADLLHRAGCETASAANAEEARAHAAVRFPDLALLDLNLPGRDGIEVLRELHALDPEMPAIILTGTGSPARAQEAMAHGAFDFFTKPFNGQALLACLANALAERLACRTGREVSRV